MVSMLIKFSWRDIPVSARWVLASVHDERVLAASPVQSLGVRVGQSVDFLINLFLRDIGFVSSIVAMVVTLGFFLNQISGGIGSTHYVFKKWRFVVMRNRSTRNIIA